MALGDWIHLAIGGLLFALLCAIAGAGLLRGADRAGLLGPVLVGLGLRFGVMAVAHCISLATGHHGFFYLDDSGYSNFGVLISRAWLHGHLVDPSGYAYSGSYASAYPTLVALVYLVVGPQVFAVKVIDVLMSGAVVFLIGRLSQQLFDPATGRRAAWLTAALPTLVWWAAPMLKEDLSILCVTAVVWAMVSLPGARAWSILLLALLVLGLTRPVFAISYGVASILAAALAMRRAGQRDVGRRVLVPAGVAGLLAIIVVSRGQPVAFVNEFQSTYGAMRQLYQSHGAGALPINLVRSLVAPYPWVFSRSAVSWYMPLYPGVLALIILYPTAAAGVWRLRRRPELLSLLVLGSIMALGLTVSAAGLAIRQRGSIEPIVLVLVAAGWRSLRRTMQFGAFGLVAAAAFAGVQSHSLAPSVGLLLIAAGLTVVARWAPHHDVGWGSVSPLRIGFDLEPLINLCRSLLQALRRALVVAPIPKAAARPASLSHWRPPETNLRASAAWLIRGPGLAAAARLCARVLSTVAHPPTPQFGSPHAISKISTRSRTLVRLVAAVLLLVGSILLLPGLRATGSASDVLTLPVGASHVPGSSQTGSLSVERSGYVVSAHASGSVRIPVPLPPSVSGYRTVVRLWATGYGHLVNHIYLVTTQGQRHLLGSPGLWVGRAFDITALVQRRSLATIEADVYNGTDVAGLFLDQIAVASAAPQSRPSAPAIVFALWIGLLAAGVLLLFGRLRRHWLFVGVAVLTAGLLWHQVRDQAYLPLSPASAAIWAAATTAHTFSLDSGLLTGSFGGLSPLTVEVYHLLDAALGKGAVSARAASLVATIMALGALYALGYRAAGRKGALTAAGLALLAASMRGAAVTGADTPVLLLSAAMFLYALHACLAEASPYAVGLLGAAGGVALLAEPTWGVGVIVAIVLVVVLYGQRRKRLRALGIGVLLLVIVALPARISTADQSGGSLFADVSRRATLARNLEFASLGHGAPTRSEFAIDPYAGQKVGLFGYEVGDHPLGVFAGRALSGANQSLTSVAERDSNGLAGLIGWLVTILGATYLLIVPRLRLLVIIPFLMAVPDLFLVKQGIIDPFGGAAPVYAGFVTGGAVLIYVVCSLLGGRLAMPAWPGRTRLFSAGAESHTDGTGRLNGPQHPEGEVPVGVTSD